MGQEVKNPLRAQSKYGLMGSSAKTGKCFFRGSQEHFLHNSAFWDRTPPTYTSIAVYMCGGGLKGPKSSNGIQLSRFVQKMAFLVILLSPCGPHHPRIVPTSSPHHPHHPCCPRHPHVVPIAPRRSPCGLHGLWSPHIVPIISTSSPLFPHCLEGPHIIPNPPDTHSTHPTAP